MEHNSQTQQIEVFSRPQSPLKSTHRELDSYNTLHETQVKIQQQINTWDELNKVFRKKQQQSFYMTFNEIMEKMAKQLAEAQQKYEQIDKEIRVDQRCQRLEKQVHFFREQCLVLRDQVSGLKKQLQGLRISNQGLKNQSFVLKKKLNKRAQVFALDKSVCGQTRFNSTATKSFYITQKSKIDQQDIALEGLIYNLKSNDPRQGVKLIKRFIKNQVRNIETPLIQRHIKNNSTAKQTPLYKSIIDPTDAGIMSKNQYLQLWSDCVKQFKINKKLVKTMPKESKFKLLQSFLSSEKFIQLLRIKIFGQKCCTNWNCLGNLQSNPNPDDSLLNSPPKRAIQTADKAFRNTYNKRNTGTNKKKIFHLDNNCFWN